MKTLMTLGFATAILVVAIPEVSAQGKKGAKQGAMPIGQARDECRAELGRRPGRMAVRACVQRKRGIN